MKTPDQSLLAPFFPQHIDWNDPSLFDRASQEEKEQSEIQRPSLSYWQDA